MKIQLILIACIVNLGFVPAEPQNQIGNQVITSKVNNGREIRENFQNLFDSISKKDAKKIEIYRDILKEEVINERQAFDEMKNELRIARSRNSNNKQNFRSKINDNENILVDKRQALKTNRTTTKLNIPQPSPEHLDVLRKFFGHSQFRVVQWRVIHSILEEKADNCLIMATGKGKSLCYQYPAVYRNGLSIVISPLISLMKDQVMGLQMSNISASFLGSAQKETNRSLSEVFAGITRVLYVTPEWSTSEFGETILKRIAACRPVTLLAIDEAHCVSHWGHDFRIAYRQLSRLKSVLPSVPILALTATATPLVKDDICKSLALRNPTITVTSFNRQNLYLSVSSKVNSKKADQVFLNLIPAMVDSASGYKFPGPTIIYCASKKRTKEVADALKMNNIKSGIYHAGLSLRERNEVHEQFLRDELDVVVATVAFGMGIDKPNVRCVVHYGLPKDIESYYQEVGRAGRDGLPAKCYIFHSYDDVILNEVIIAKSSNVAFAEHKRLQMKRMRNFCETKYCRRHLLLSYFNEPLSHGPDEPQPNCCDNCDKLLYRNSTPVVRRIPMINLTGEIKLLLRVFSYFGGRFGIIKPIKFLRGAKDGKFTINQMKNEMYGAGKQHSETAWKALARFCIEEHLLEEIDSQNPFKKTRAGNKSVDAFFGSTIRLSPMGHDFMYRFNEKELPFDLPEQTEKLFRKKRQVSDELVDSWALPDWDEPWPANKRVLEKGEETAFLHDQELLYGELKKLRDSIAVEQNCPPHTIVEDSTCYLMAVHPPSDVQTLALVEGFSGIKAENFGQRFIDIIKEFRESRWEVDELNYNDHEDFMRLKWLNENSISYSDEKYFGYVYVRNNSETRHSVSAAQAANAESFSDLDGYSNNG